MFVGTECNGLNTEVSMAGAAMTVGETAIMGWDSLAASGERANGNYTSVLDVVSGLGYCIGKAHGTGSSTT